MSSFTTLVAARARRSWGLSCTLVLSLWLGLAPAVQAQVPLNPANPAAADTTHKYENPAGIPTAAKKPFYKSKLFKAAIVPAVLIGYGAYTFNGGGFYTNQEAQRDIHRLFPKSNSRIADYLIFAPYLELGAVALAGVESRNDRINVLLIIAKSEAIMLSSTFIVKALSHEERPDGSDNLSFPSGHTAQAFLAASIVHTEFRDKSQWYGIGAYAIATSVAERCGGGRGLRHLVGPLSLPHAPQPLGAQIHWPRCGRNANLLREHAGHDADLAAQVSGKGT
jgi:hypothetical protein